MKESARERKAEARRGGRRTRRTVKRDVLAKIAEMPEPERAMAERIHAIVKASAPDISPKTWYGMPAYAKDGKVICFFKAADEVQVQVLDPRLRRRTRDSTTAPCGRRHGQ